MKQWLFNLPFLQVGNRQYNTSIYYFPRLIYWLTDRTSLLWGQISIRARSTTLCDKVCQWLATSRWFSPGPPISSTKKSDRHDVTEILLEVALSTIKQTNIHSRSNGFRVSHLFSFLFYVFVLCLSSFVLCLSHYVQPCCRVDFNVYLGLCVGCNLLVLNFSAVHILHTQSETPHRLTVIFLFLLVVHFTDLGIFNMYQFYVTFRWCSLKIQPQRWCNI